MVSIQSLAYSRSLSPWFVERPLFALIRPGVSFLIQLTSPAWCLHSLPVTRSFIIFIHLEIHL